MEICGKCVEERSGSNRFLNKDNVHVAPTHYFYPGTGPIQMLHKTKGVVLNYIRFKESSIIARIYTEKLGIQSYLVNGVRSSKSKSNRIALFQPLTLLDMVVYHQSRPDALHRLSEVRNQHPFGMLPFDMVRTSLALFITELLGKCLKEEEPNEPLFQFLEHTVVALDSVEAGLESFHLSFMVHLAGYLGFGIETAGEFAAGLREHRYSSPPDEVQQQALDLLLGDNELAPLSIGKAARNALLAQLLFYYRTHLEGFGEMKSLEVLRAVLR